MPDITSGNVFANANLPPMRMQDLQAMTSMLSGQMDRGMANAQMGGPQMAMIQARADMQRKQAAENLQNYLALAKQFPTMKMPQSVAQGTGAMFSNPLQQMMMGAGGRMPGAIEGIPTQAPWQSETEGKVGSMKMLWDYINGLPTESQPGVAKMLGFDIKDKTPRQKESADSAKQVAMNAIDQGLVYDADYGRFVRGNRKPTKQEMMDALMDYQAITKLPLTKDPEIIAKLNTLSDVPEKSKKNLLSDIGEFFSKDKGAQPLVKSRSPKTKEFIAKARAMRDAKGEPAYSSEEIEAFADAMESES